MKSWLQILLRIQMDKDFLVACVERGLEHRKEIVEDI